MTHPLVALAAAIGSVCFAAGCGVVGYRWTEWRDRRRDQRRGRAVVNDGSPQAPTERSETVAATHAEANGIDLIIDTNITRSTKA